MRTTWTQGVLVACLIPACGGPRELSRKEAMIPILPGANSDVNAVLQRTCTEIGTIRDAPTAQDRSFTTALKVVSGNPYPCLPNISSLDDIRRCAGEHQAQAVQIVGRKKEDVDDRNWIEFVRALNQYQESLALSQHSWGDWMAARYRKAQIDDWARNAVRTRTVALDLRLWRCPASRALPTKGELVWRRESVSKLDLLQDGVRIGGAGEYDKLPEIVGAHPAALDFAQEALAHQSSAYTKVYVGLPFAVLALAADAVAVVGMVKNSDKLSYGGLAGGIVFTSIAVPILVSGGTSMNRAQTSAMKATDAWNDEYLHGKDTATASPANLRSISPEDADL
jgi:hypothetical protein